MKIKDVYQSVSNLWMVLLYTQNQQIEELAIPILPPDNRDYYSVVSKLALRKGTTMCSNVNCGLYFPSVLSTGTDQAGPMKLISRAYRDERGEFQKPPTLPGAQPAQSAL